MQDFEEGIILYESQDMEFYDFPQTDTVIEGFAGFSGDDSGWDVLQSMLTTQTKIGKTVIKGIEKVAAGFIAMKIAAGIASEDGYIYFIPLNNNSIFRINMISAATSAIAVGAISTTGGEAYFGGCYINGVIYSAIGTAGNILRIDTLNSSVTTITPPTTTSRRYGCTAHENGNIYYAPYTPAGTFWEYNPTSKIFNQFGSGYGYASIQAHPNGKLYAFNEAPAGTIVEIDVENKTITTVGSATNGNLYSCLGSNGNIYALSANKTTISEVNVTNKTVVEFGSFLQTNNYYLDIKQLPNGKLYSCPGPNQKGTILEVDIEERTATQTASINFGPDAGGGWTLAPSIDGSFYIMPYGGVIYNPIHRVTFTNEKYTALQQVDNNNTGSGGSVFGTQITIAQEPPEGYEERTYFSHYLNKV